MAEYDFDWVDAFTETPFGGNACAVVHGAADLDVDLQVDAGTGSNWDEAH